MIDNKDGSFLIPEECFVDKPYNNWLAKVIRKTGQTIIYFGSWVKSLGYYQVKIHPYRSILEAIEETSSLRSIMEDIKAVKI